MSDQQQKKALRQRLIDYADQLDSPQLHSLIDYAAFLLQRHGGAAPTEVSDPEPIERPDDESVIAAIKRLSATYPMLDKDQMLRETSSLVAQHVMQGRDATDVIDEMEEVFYHHFQKLKSRGET